MSKQTIISIIIAIVTILIALMIVSKKDDSENTLNFNRISDDFFQGFDTSNSNVKIVDGKQIIEIRARGGYYPRKTVAKANIPTIIRYITKGTYDCSASIYLPSKKINRILPQSGETDIDIGSPEMGKFSGTCGMGMYSFEINFEK